MKKISILLIALSFFFVGEVKSQAFDVSMLDKAMGLLDKGNSKESSKVLGNAMSLLTKNTQASSGDFASKIIGQAGNLMKMMPALEAGTANIPGIQKIIQTIKTLYGAMQLNQMVKGGNLLGNTSSLLSNVNLLKSGMSMFEGGKSVDKITKSLDKVIKKAPKLDKTGWGAKMAQKAISKKLGTSLTLLNGLI
ncbi:hypothetical protein [Portibacter lacus]|uniref:Uncharacterized protein n=1 Tax=Portibacter lacus TaxID=1099794 RepID=A0AA37SS41_9BACT|nr:hypothetical protein [Portibacter lacus]GLR19891.1 hypothetical protein GCM10007940_45070 [Portibacter lacus]